MLGHVAQSIGGALPGGGFKGFSVPRIFIADGAFTAPVSGDYLVSGWGGGAPGSIGAIGGDSAASGRKKVTLSAGDVLSFAIGQGGTRTSTTLVAGTATTVTGPGINATANGTGASGGPAATATGWDTNLPGLVATDSNGPGANSPTGSDVYGPISGGRGGNGSRANGVGNDARGGEGRGFGAGGGAAQSDNAASWPGRGGDGLLIITYLTPGA